MNNDLDWLAKGHWIQNLCFELKYFNIGRITNSTRRFCCCGLFSELKLAREKRKEASVDFIWKSFLSPPPLRQRLDHLRLHHTNYWTRNIEEILYICSHFLKKPNCSRRQISVDIHSDYFKSESRASGKRSKAKTNWSIHLFLASLSTRFSKQCT